MFEIFAFLCSLAILVPSLFITSILFNINRKVQGKEPLSTEDAIKESFRLFKKRCIELWNQIFHGSTKKATTKNIKPANVEDATFREAKE